MASEERRLEIKFAFHAAQRPAVEAMVATHPAGFRTEHPQRRVNNIYLDTPNLTLFNDNREGFADRRKVRIRWYGDDDHGVGAALEVKLRSGRGNYKLRHPLTGELCLTGDENWASIVARAYRDLPIEVAAAVEAATRAVLVTRYQRAYYATTDGAIRLTVDHTQAMYSQLAQYRPNLRYSLPPPLTGVVELKAPVTLEERLRGIAAALPLRVSRHSKYAIALERALYA
jgi:hypothetical protein